MRTALLEKPYLSPLLLYVTAPGCEPLGPFLTNTNKSIASLGLQSSPAPATHRAHGEHVASFILYVKLVLKARVPHDGKGRSWLQQI